MLANTKYAEAAEQIKNAIANGDHVTPKDMDFLKSFLAINAKSAGNAGRRKAIRTGK